MTILFLTEDQHQSSVFMSHLQEMGYSLVSVNSLKSLWESFPQTNPDLLIMDANPYGIKRAIEVCESIRNNPTSERTPLLVISDYADTLTTANLLDAGADDLLRHPVEVRELGARVRALLRWLSKKSYSPKAQINLYPNKHLVIVDHQREVWLTPIEFKLINFLALHQDRYFSAEELLTTVWNYPPNKGDTALVRNHIRNLRRKLEQDPDRPAILISRYGQGYTIEAIVHQS